MVMMLTLHGAISFCKYLPLFVITLFLGAENPIQTVTSIIFLCMNDFAHFLTQWKHHEMPVFIVLCVRNGICCIIFKQIYGL